MLGVCKISLTMSLVLFTHAVVPPIALIASGLGWFLWRGNASAIPATLLSLGVALLALVSLVALAYTFPSASSLAGSTFVLFGGSLLVYGAMIGVLARRSTISMLSVVICGVIGLIPLYWLGGYVLIYTACSFGTAGC